MTIDLGKELREALETSRIAPHFQPLVDLRRGRLVGFEVLARWTHPQLGMVPPDTFIPLAEASGQIDQLTEQVLREACAAAVCWPHDLPIGINVSPLQLQQASFVDRVRQIAAETAFPLDRLVVEITEKALVKNYHATSATLTSLKALGVCLGDCPEIGGMTTRALRSAGYIAGWGSWMEWVLRLVGTGVDGQSRSFDVMEISRPDGVDDIANLGLTLAEGKLLLAGVQQGVVAAQADSHATLRPDCRSCGGRCHVKDWRPRRIATLFGEARVQLPRFLCAGCGRTETGLSWSSHCRSTPELDQLQARLSALMTFRVAAEVMVHVLPIDAGKNPETLRGHTLQVGERLGSAAVGKPAAVGSAITVSLDSTFIRSCEEGECHLEVRVGNVETAGGGRQVFGAVAKADTDITALVRRNLQIVGRTADTAVTAFTDGCSGLRSILANVGLTKPPILDWFHIAMRLRHATQAASGLSTDSPDRVQAKAVIVAEVERLRWRIWNGEAKNAQRSVGRIRKVMHVFQGEHGHRTRGVPSGKLWSALHEVDSYLSGQSAWLVNYAERYRAGLRVGTSITEGTANFLVNRRMNKSQQMRWSRRGADLLLQVRCAVYNGTLGSGIGHRFKAFANPEPVFAMAA